MSEYCAVYIMTNRKNGTLYIGSTKDIRRRIQDHKTLTVDSFTKKYGLTNCVYIERCENLEQALLLEKRYKKYNREWKLNLIRSLNPEWQDLSEKLNTVL